MPDEPAWFEGVLDSLAAQGAVVQRADDHGPGSPSIRVLSPTHPSFDLSALPAEAAVALHIEGPRQLRLTVKTLVKDAKIVLHRDDMSQPGGRTEAPDLVLADDVSGAVEIHCPNRRPLRIASVASRGPVRIGSGALLLAEDFSQAAPVYLYSGELHLIGHRRRVVLHGEGHIVPAGKQDAARWTVETLRVFGSSKLLLKDGQIPSIGHLHGDPGTRLELGDSGANKDTTPLKIGEITDVTLDASSQVFVSGVRKAAQLTAGGPIALTFADSVYAEGIRFERNEAGVPNLAVGANSVLAELAGEVELGKVAGAHLAGGRDGFTVAGIRDRRSYHTTPPQTCVAETVMTGFKFPRGLEGRQLLTALIETFHIDPFARDLPGWDRRLHLEVRRLRLRSSLQPETSRRLHHDAEFLRELQRLAAQKGAPGATRTRVAWCAYRLRQATTVGWFERIALAGYRCIGYGERPGPAFLTWLVLACVGAAIVLGTPIDVSPEGAARLVKETLRQAAGPLAGVLHSGGVSLAHQWEYVIRAIVAVPLVTGVFALRNYVKGPGRD